MKKLILTILLILLIAVGAVIFVRYRTSTNYETASNSNPPVTNPENQTTQAQIKNLPPDVSPEQINANFAYSINSNLYLLALEPSSNHDIPALNGTAVQWHGVLRSQDNGQTWTKFFSITDPPDPTGTAPKIKYNPAGVFAEGQKLYVDIVNDRGAGSGEGQLIRFSTGDDGKTWRRENCYYFTPENYYPNYNNSVNGWSDISKIDPHKLEKIENCAY